MGSVGDGGRGDWEMGKFKRFLVERDPVERWVRITMQIGRLRAISRIDRQYLDSLIGLVNYVTLFFSSYAI